MRGLPPQDELPTAFDCSHERARQSLLAATGAVAQPLADEPLRRLLGRIAAQQELRFFLDGTKNLGHQSATVSLLKRVIELLDYRGRITVVYADYDNPFLGSTAEKIALLLPRVDPRSLDCCTTGHHTCDSIRFVRYADRHSLRDQVEFGFTGGADDMAVNYAHELNVRCFARLQPYLWDDAAERKEDPYYESSRFEFADARHFYPVDACDGFRLLTYKPAPSRSRPVAASVWRWYEREQSFDAGLAMRTKNIRSLVASCSHQSALLWPLYGLQHFGDTAASIAANCAMLAMNVRCDAGPPIVIVSLSPAADCPGMSEVLRLGGNSRLSVLSGFDEHVGEYLDISARIREAVCRMGSAEVLFVIVGPVPGAVFDRLLKIADLPPVIEGQATSSLAICSGRAFFQIPRPGHLIINSYPTAVSGRDYAAMSSSLNEAARRLTCSDGHLALPLDVVLDALDPQSDLSSYFRRLACSHGQDASDKFLVACRALAELID
jgi:hypothetical protein